MLNDPLVSLGDGEIDDWKTAHTEIYQIIENLTGPGQLYLLHQVKTSTTFVNRLGAILILRSQNFGSIDHFPPLLKLLVHGIIFLTKIRSRYG